MVRAFQATALVAVCGLFALLVWKLTHQSHPPKLGGPAPNFTLARLEGSGAIDLRALRGKPVVLNFFASWCEPCKAESKVLETAWQKYKSQGVVFVGVDYHDVTSDGRRFLTAHDITYPTVKDGSGSVGDKYGLTGVPETFFIDPRGRLVGYHIEGTVAAAKNKPRFIAGIEAALHS